MAIRWTIGEIELLRQYYPNCDMLEKLLGKSVETIKSKATRLGLSRSKPVQPQKFRRRIALIQDTSVTRRESPSYRAMILQTEENIDKSLLALQSARDLVEWTRCLDEYRYWTVRRAQVEANRRLYE
jgi:hypothetical protein